MMSTGEQQIEGEGGPVRRSWGALSIFPIVGLTVLYTALAALHPLLSGSILSVFCLSLLFLLSSAVVFAHPNKDPLDPLRLSALIFLSVYCVAPLFTQHFNWYFKGNEQRLLGEASAYVLVAFMALCIGYAAGPSFRPTGEDAAQPVRQVPIARLGLIIFAVGFLAYLVAIVSAGGPARMFGSEESRVQFFKGIGWLYWAAFFMLPGGALFFAASNFPRSRVPWFYTWPLLAAFVSFALLQGRFRALRAVICLLILWHYQVRRFKAIELSLFGAAGFGFFVFVGYARDPRIRPYLLSDPIGVIQEVAANFFEFSQGIIGDTISRLPQVMLAFDAFPDRDPFQWGKTLVLSLNPVFRIVGLPGLQVENAGTKFFQLAHPNMPTWLETGYHTSLAGELLANFPWFLTLPMVAAFGLVLKLLYVRMIRRSHSVLSVAGYAIVLFPILSMFIVGVGLVLFEIAVVLAPLALARPLWRRHVGPLQSSEGTAVASPASGDGVPGAWT